MNIQLVEKELEIINYRKYNSVEGHILAHS